MIGLVISIHIVGMFAFSPLTGLAVDRFGGRAVAIVGSVILSTATLLASAAPEGGSLTITAGLFLLGLGWSCTLVAGSTMLTAAVPACPSGRVPRGPPTWSWASSPGSVGRSPAWSSTGRASRCWRSWRWGSPIVVGLVAALSAVRTHPAAVP